MTIGTQQRGPRTAAIWSVLRSELDKQPGKVFTVVDIGGGTGGFAVPLAEAGHRVTVVDPSPDALAALMRRAADAGVAERGVTAVQGDAESLAELVPDAGADLVLCHAVLEVVDDPAKVAAALAAALRPGGAASVLVANRAAAVLSRAIAGQWHAVSELMAGSGAGRRRFTADTAAQLLRVGGLTVEQIHGVRVVADLVPGVVADADPEALTAFELAVSQSPPYRDIATQLHLLARR